MAATDVTRTPATHDVNGHTGSRPSTARRLVTETKAAFKTTEFFMTVAAVVGILISAMVIKGGDTAGPTSSLPVRHGSTSRSSSARTRSAVASPRPARPTRTPTSRTAVASVTTATRAASRFLRARRASRCSVQHSPGDTLEDL